MFLVFLVVVIVVVQFSSIYQYAERERWTTVITQIGISFLYSLFVGSIFIYLDQLIVPVGRVFANDPGDLGSIPVCVIPKTQRMVLDTSLLNIQQYKVRIKGKVEQSREKSSALPFTLL